MKKINLILTLLFLSLIFISCSGSSGGGSDPAPQEEQDPGGTTGAAARLTYDSELSIRERQALDASTAELGALIINGGQIKWFEQIFGGGRSSNVVNYFENRVNYGLSASTDLNDRIVFTNNIFAEGVTVASNPSVGLWYFAKAVEPEVMKFEINGKLLSINSSRIGIMQFGAFVEFNTTEQIKTLVHEARHSDCTGGAWASDIDRIRNGLSPLNKLCGNFHELCPPGHPLADEYACDAHPWGAYAIDAIYAATLALECSSCTESQKILAEQLFYDSVSRLLYNFNDLLNGSYGSPNMRNSDQIR